MGVTSPAVRKLGKIMTKRYGHMERMKKKLSKNMFDSSLKGRRRVRREG
jgi:hypothetical protein